MWHLWFLAAGVLHAPVYSSPPPLAVLLTIACVLLAFSRRLWSSLPACLLLGLAFGSWHLQQKCARQLLPEFEQQVFDLSFQVVSIPRQSGRSQVFLARVSESHCSGHCPQLDKGLMRLSWYQNLQTVQSGQLWRAQVKLRRPRGFINPDGFDYHAWLLAQDVIATGYIARQGEYLGESFAWATERSQIETMLAANHASPYRRFWAALLIGEQAEIKAADWSVLQATGTVHLLVISGLHISLAATWCFVLGALVARFAGLLQPGSNLRLMHYLPPLSACLGAIYYAALAGFTIPTQRAMVACLVLMFCRLLGLNFSPFTLLGMAALVVGVLEPFAWTNSGFWLSFLAVAVLFYSLGGRGRMNAGSALVRAQLVLSIGLLLPLLSLGQGTSLVSPIANLIAVPVVSVVLVPLLLVATVCSGLLPQVAVFLLQLMDWIFGNLWWFLEWVQGWPISLWWPTKTLSAVELAIAVIGTVLLLAPSGLQVRCLGGVWVFLALLPRPEQDFLLRMTVLDVGQGTAVVVETPQQTWLYDTGPQFSEQFDAGSRIVAPYLRGRGVKNLNLIISHGDMDHAGGAEGIFSAFSIDQFLYGEPLPTFSDRGRPCRAGQIWQQDQVTWNVLWPHDSSVNGNNASCTVLLTVPTVSGDVRVLLPGDIDRHVEAQLLADLQAPVDWVLAPHHGSNSSSSINFVRQLAAQHVVFSAGFNNRYGHPHPRVIQRWEAVDAELYNTATDGALIFTWHSDGVKVERVRQTLRRLWHANGPPW